MSLQPVWVRRGGGRSVASSGREGLGQQVQGGGRPHLELPEHEVRVEVELERDRGVPAARTRRSVKLPPTHPPLGERGTCNLGNSLGGLPRRRPPRQLPATTAAVVSDAGRGVRPRHRRHLWQLAASPCHAMDASQASWSACHALLTCLPSPAHPPSLIRTQVSARGWKAGPWGR